MGDGTRLEGMGLSLPFLRKQRLWRSSGGGRSPAQKDEKEYEKWATRAMALLEAGNAPSWKEAGGDDVRRGLLGKTRASTLRLRVRTFGSLVRWLQWRRNRTWPVSQ